MLQIHMDPHVGEKLWLKHEENNKNDPRAVAVFKDSIVVSHLPVDRLQTS